MVRRLLKKPSLDLADLANYWLVSNLPYLELLPICGDCPTVIPLRKEIHSKTNLPFTPVTPNRLNQYPNCCLLPLPPVSQVKCVLQALLHCHAGQLVWLEGGIPLFKSLHQAGEAAGADVWRTHLKLKAFSKPLPHGPAHLLREEYKSVDKCEELVINTTATINNLSYYHVKNSIILEKNLYIAELLIKVLMSSNMDGILEAVRVFGNLSQYDEICDFIVQRKVYKFMIALFDAKHQDLCFSACGVLLNLTVDRSRRTILNEEGAIKKLIDCLRDFGPTDWQLACLICKTLWNYSENVTSSGPCLEEEDSNTLLILLASFLDEELALDYNLDSHLRDYHKLYWESEFKPVAQKLLQRIQN